MLLLWGFYVLFLEKENMHVTKRFYLIFSLVFSLVIPLITFTYTTNTIQEVAVSPEPIVTSMVFSDQVLAPSPPPVDYTLLIVWFLYGVGVLVFGIRFIKNLKNITVKIKNSEQLKEASHIKVLINETMVPYTFLKYIFVSKKAYQEKGIPEAVLLHEKTHVIQKHTLDILFIELLQIFFWFNPLLIWIKKSIKLNHEFLADQTVLERQFSLQVYMNMLVNYPNNSNQVELSSPINYSLTKKRIVMMSRQFSKTRAAARLLLLLPTLIGCMLLFNNEIIAQQKNVKYEKTVQDTHPDKKIKIKIVGDNISVNDTPTNISSFAKTIDDLTKQWKDDELTEFNFNVQMQNVDEGLLEKLNTVYRNTRLYKANPDGHDLIPPPPPSPQKLKMAKVLEEEKKLIKTPGSPMPPKVRKGKKGSIPPPPPPISPQIKEEIEEEIEADFKEEIEAEIEEEFAYEIASVMEAAEHSEHMAMDEVHRAQEAAAHARHRAMEAAHMAREQSHNARKEAMERAKQARHRAMEAAQMAREQSNTIREEALEQAKQARHLAMEAADRARAQSHTIREEAMELAQSAREMAEIAKKAALKEVHKARRNTLKKRHRNQQSKKQQLEAQQKAIKAELKAVKKRLKEERKANKN